MNLKGKKLLILAGADVHCKVVKAAKELGVYTIVTDYLPIEESPAKQIADEAWQLNIMDVDLIVERCRAEKVDGVLAFCIDPAQIPYQRICEKLGVPCYGTREQFEIMTNKRKFKDFCKKVSVDCIPEYSLEDVEQDRVKYPVLVKPSDSRGSRGQTVCYYKSQIKSAVDIAEKESSDGVALIERYMLGKQDFSLAYIVINSVPYLLKIGDRFLGTQEDNLERQHICTLLPSLSADGYKERVEPKVFRLIKALDVKFGAIFLQGFIENDHVYFYDPGLRFPGGDFDVVLEKATGFSSMSSMVKFALTGDITSCTGNPKEAYKLNGGTCMILSIAVRPGKIGTFKGLDVIAKDSHVFSVGQRSHVGDVIPDSGDLKQRAAELVAYFPSREDAEIFCQKVYDTVSILDENGKDMIVSKMGQDISFRNVELISCSKGCKVNSKNIGRSSVMKDMSYLKDMPIAVLGGGAVGKTCAADCKLAGREVRLYSRSEKSIANLEKTGILLDGIQRNLYGFERSGRAFLDVVSTDMSKVVKGAGIIIIGIPAHAHEHYLKTLVPLLEDGQVVHVFTDNYASLLLRKYMREMGCTKKVIVGGWGSAPYGTRIEKIGKFMLPHVGAKYRAITLRGACQPMTDMHEFMESVKYMPCMDAVTYGDGPVRGDTMIDIGFSNVNPVIHVPASILGVSSMENWSAVYGKDPDTYSMYSHGLCPSICRVQYQFYEEEKNIAKAIGVKVPEYSYESFFSRRSILTQEYMGLDENGKDNVVFPLDKPCDEGNTGPNSIDHRYITEDIPVGCKIYHDLGVKFGVPTPIIDSMIVLGGAMHEKSYFEETKYNLDYLGIGHMTKEELLDYLYTGKYVDAPTIGGGYNGY